MSGGDARVIERLLNAFNNRDTETWVEFTTPDCELYTLRSQLEGTVYRGHEGVRRVYHDFDVNWASLQLRVERVVEAPDGVVAIAHLRAKSTGSGIELDTQIGWHFRFSDGLVRYGRSYSDPEDALRAAGAES